MLAGRGVSAEAGELQLELQELRASLAALEQENQELRSGEQGEVGLAADTLALRHSKTNHTLFRRVSGC